MAEDQGKKIRLCVLGDGNVGKSALTIRYFQDQFVEDWDPTIEDLYVKKDALGGKFFQLEVQDTAGQEQFALLRNDYIRHADGFLIVYSVAQQPSSEPDSKTSFENVERYYNDIRAYHNDQKPVFIAGNKIDLRRVVSEGQGRELATRLGVGYIETSAKTKANVTETFQTLCQLVLDEPEGNDTQEVHQFNVDPVPPEPVRTDTKPGDGAVGCKCIIL